MSKSNEIKDLRKQGEFTDNRGEIYKITGAIEVEEIELFERIFDVPDATVLDIGVGKGVSTALFASLSNVKAVVGIDPFQSSEHKRSVFKLYDLLKLQQDKLTLIEKMSIEAKPYLDSLNTRFDYVFIDGYHSFDATIVDFLISNPYLKDNGYMVFHDCYYPQKQKVLNFILRNRDYTLCSIYPKCRLPLYKRTVRMIWHCLKYKSNILSSIKYLNPFLTDSSIVVLKKISAKEPKYWEFNGL